jgi:hypothetical protein
MSKATNHQCKETGCYAVDENVSEFEVCFVLLRCRSEGTRIGTLNARRLYKTDAFEKSGSVSYNSFNNSGCSHSLTKLKSTSTKIVAYRANSVEVV